MKYENQYTALIIVSQDELWFKVNPLERWKNPTSLWTSHGIPEQSLHRLDNASIGPIPALVWHIIAYLQEWYTETENRQVDSPDVH